MLKQLKMAILTTLAIGFLNVGCGTVVPKAVEDHSASFDSSSPDDVDPLNSGLIDFTRMPSGKVNGALVTSNFRAKYNFAISQYRIQFQKETGHALAAEDGQPVKIENGKMTYWIDAEHLAYAMKLNRWLKEGRDSDSIWARVKDGMGP